MLPVIMIIILYHGDSNQLERILEIIKKQTYPNLIIRVFNEDTTSCLPMGMTEFQVEELLQSDTNYVIFIDDYHSMFEESIEKLYYTAALTDADITMGNYADYSDGQFYFYNFGQDWIVKSVSKETYLENNATSEVATSSLYGSLDGKLFHKRLFNNLMTWISSQLNWRLAIEAQTIAYVNYPTSVRISRQIPVQSYYKESLQSFQELMKVGQSLSNFSIEKAKKHYIQLLANYSEWLKNEGAIKESNRVYQMLITAENGIFPFLDLLSLDFTIISNNCVGGLIYKQMGLPYTTPFVGLFILPEDYYRLTKDIRSYLELPIVFDEELKLFQLGQYFYPVGHLGDVTLHFLHYESVEEARDKWNRRKKRMNWNNIYFKFDNKDGITDELLEKVDQLPYHNKIILVHKKYPQLTHQQVVEVSDENEVGIINTPLQAWDVISWLNKGGNKL